MRTFMFAATLAAVSVAVTASAADYTSIVLEKEVNASADKVWSKVGGFCALKDWMKIDCVMASGTGDVGSVRSLMEGKIKEVMVAKTPHSYTYAFENPNPTFYHGTLSVVPDGAAKSKIVYTLFYDQESLGTPEAKAADRQRRMQAFGGALDNMKALSEAK